MKQEEVWMRAWQTAFEAMWTPECAHSFCCENAARAANTCLENFNAAFSDRPKYTSTPEYVERTACST